MAPPPGLAPGLPLEKFSSTKQQFLKTNYILKEIASGTFGTVFVSIPKKAADKLIAKHSSSSSSSSADLYTSLRQHLQAAKISKAVEMSSEISLLKDMKKVSSRSLPTLPNLISSSNDMSMTIELLSGGTLNQLHKQYMRPMQLTPEPFLPPLPVALLWHWIAQICQTFLYLHQGILPPETNGEEVDEDWVPTIHNDIHGSNIMFRSPPSPSSSYPDFVLCDFGNAITWSCTTGTDGKNWISRKEKQISDVLFEFERFVNHTDASDEEHETLIAQFDQIPSSAHPSGVSDYSDVLEREWLEKILRVAERKREELYRPLPEELKAYFSRPVIGDEELGEFVKRVKREESPESSGSEKDGKRINLMTGEEEKTAGCGCPTM